MLPTHQKIAFIGFGEAAQAFVRSLREGAALDVSAYDIKIHGPEAAPLRGAADRLRVRLADTAANAISGATLVFSAVTAAASTEALHPTYDAPVHAHTLIDINSVTAARKAQNAELVRRAGARYLDMAVMAPVNPAGHRTPVLVAGDTDPVLAHLRALDFRLDVAGPNPGDAASIKMIRSLFVKGLEALTVQTLTAAEAAGCGARVLESLAGSYPGLDLHRFAPYQFERVVTHGKRRAEEVREVAQAMVDLGFGHGAALAAAIAALQDAVAAARPALGTDARDCARATAAALAAVANLEPRPGGA
jgi:3-hydroxyisobutyrate dehydrogenase-like beta-hydroxyacid dehydrogenase